MQNKQLNNKDLQAIIQMMMTLNVDEMYNKYVDPRIAEIMKEKVTEYNTLRNYDMADVKLYQELDEMYRQKGLEILYSTPYGVRLPMFKKLCLGGGNNE